ncbi:hypothetical protein, partial [Fictibacillus sp. NRS-1165]|uniref:hypothetical protein n=1 Tax=Fictibacillus sp. NRS-1165 TaxID=3144463 RepID=UPI003D231F64
TAKKLKNKTAGLLKIENSEDQENTNASNEKQDHQEINLQDNNEEQDHQEVNAKDNNDEQFQILEYENRKLNERLKLIEKKLEQLAPLSEEEKNDEDVIVDRDEKDEQRPLKVSSKNKRIKNDKKPKEFTISSNDDTSSK